MSIIPREYAERLKKLIGLDQPVVHIHVNQSPDYQGDASKIAKALNQHLAAKGQSLGHGPR